jgi:hypothetical protein
MVAFKHSEMMFALRSRVNDPDSLLGLAGLNLSVVFFPIGLPVSLSARRRSRALGLENEPAEWGVAISTVMLGLLAGALVLGIAFTFMPRLIL